MLPTPPKMHSTFFEHICRGCSSYRCLKIGSFPFNDHRHPGFSDLFICLECKTAFFTHTSRIGSNSATWHQKVYERNMEWSHIFHSHLKRSNTPFKRVRYWLRYWNTSSLFQKYRAVTNTWFRYKCSLHKTWH